MAKGSVLLEATAFMAALVCWNFPLIHGLIVEILLGLFLRDQGATDGIFELSRALIRVLDDVYKIAAEG